LSDLIDHFSDAAIRAPAQIDTDISKKCSGGSGGLIRLKAQKVSHMNSSNLNEIVKNNESE